MRDTELINTMHPTNLDIVVFETTARIMELASQPLPHGATIGRKAQIQELVRDAITKHPQSALAVYWYNRFQELSAHAGRLRTSLAKADYELAQLREVKDGAYEERNMVVAALAKCFPSGIGKTVIEGWDPAWHNCVYIDLPTGQASWHYHDDHAHLFAALPAYARKWDGHTTPEKYERMAALKPGDVFNTASYRVQSNEDGTELLMSHPDFVEYGIQAFKDGYRPTGWME